MNEKLQIASKVSGGASYLSGGGTFLGGVLGFLNEHGVAVGAMCAIATAVANIVFKWLERRDRLKGDQQ